MQFLSIRFTQPIIFSYTTVDNILQLQPEEWILSNFLIYIMNMEITHHKYYLLTAKIIYFCNPFLWVSHFVTTILNVLNTIFRYLREPGQLKSARAEHV